MATVHGGSSPHVRFVEDQVEAHDAEIALNYLSGDHVDIHLGFLKINHRYHITFAVKDSLGDKITIDENENIAIFKSVPTDDGHQLVIDLTAYKERLMEEMFTVYSARDKRKTISIVFHARVLGRGQGTPALRHGIQCVSSTEKPELSGASLEATGDTSA